MNLVTGATGHIGNVLVRQLLERGEKVRALVLANDNLTPLEGLNVEIVRGNVLNPASIETALRGADVVYHLAAIITIMPGKNERVQRINVEGTRNMLQAARKIGTRRFIYTSSIHAIKRVPHGVVIDESLPYDPYNPYGAYDTSKAQASLMVQQAARDGMDALLACPTGVMGPYDFRVSLTGFGLMRYWGAKEARYFDGGYDFVDVRDVASGLIAIAQKGRKGESYLLSGHHLRNRQMAEIGLNVAGRNAPIREAPLGLIKFLANIMPVYYRLAKKSPQLTPYAIEVLQSNANISHAKATRELGYQPRPLEETIHDAMHWYQDNKEKLIPEHIL